MLETNNPYMFGSSTTTTTTTTTSNQSSSQSPSSAPPPSSSSLAGNQNTTTSISNNNNNNHNHHMQQSRPIHHNDNSNNNYFIGKGGEDDYYRNHQQSSRINPTFVRHPEEQQQSSQPPINYTSTYKANKSINNNNNNTNNNIHQHNESEKINNFMRPSVHVYPQQQQQQQQQHIKRELSPNMLTPSTFMKSKKLVEEPDWYERENKSHKPSTPAIITSTTTVTPTPTPTPTSLLSTSAVAEVSTLEAGDNKKIKRRKEMTGIMEDLNKDFIKKREKLYIEKLNAVNQELKEANQDKHSTYIDGLKDLEMIRKKTIDDGVLFRKYQNEVTDNQFQLEIYQAEEEYTAEIQDIREKLFAGLDEKRRKLKEEKDNCDLAYDVILESQARLHKRNLRKREKEHPENKSSKKKQLTGPALVFKLKDDDILSDIQAMRNGLSSNTTNTALSASTPPKKTNSSNKKK
ncbi:hypothetical protein INT46_000820 [Mucor plumbeus]|uniref:Uncharacterized protein n=1 Tax=Mucor plumbeus TaxID=97098 RepID=A0A8H7RND7_9FUNG|nr:hypothetical protein INT46_000820 [Mucor plumbeus]